MQLHELKPIHKAKKAKRIGRGGKKGTYCGKGMKGQKAREGRRFAPIIRSLIKRYPKLRGYKFKPLGIKPAIVNLELLEAKFQSGDKINPQTLLEKKLIRRMKDRMPQVKILGTGKLTKALSVENCLVSKQAKEKIEHVHGLVK